MILKTVDHLSPNLLLFLRIGGKVVENGGQRAAQRGQADGEKGKQVLNYLVVVNQSCRTA